MYNLPNQHVEIMAAKRTYIDNGANVLYNKLPQAAGTVSLGIAIRVGTRDDPPHLAGITHWTEHMLGTATKKYKNEVSLYRALAPYAPESDIDSGVYRTLISIIANAEHLEKGVGILSEMVVNPRFPKRAVYKEKGAILIEINNALDNPNELADEQFSKIIFAGTALSRPMRGNKSSLTRLTHRDIEKFCAQYYIAANIALVAAGDFSERRLLRAAERYLGKAPIGVANVRVFTKPKNSYIPRTVRIHRYLKQAYVRIGFPIRPELDEREALIWEVFEEMLADGEASKLYEEARAKTGIVYGIGASTHIFPDMSAFIIDSACRPKNVQRLLQICKRAARDVLEDRKRFNEVIKKKLEDHKMTYDKPEAIFENMVYAWSENDQLYLPGRKRFLLKGLSLRDVRREVEPYLDPDGWSIVIVGP